MRVYKFAVPLDDRVTIDMPVGAKLLKFDYQDHPMGSGLFIWALVNERDMLTPRSFAIRGTGHQCDGLRADQYVGSASQGGLVWHLFDMGEL